jgi:hypothetical protein
MGSISMRYDESLISLLREGGKRDLFAPARARNRLPEVFTVYEVYF